MQLEQLFQQLEKNDIRLWLEDGQLRFSAPKGGFDERLRQQIQQEKTAIIEFLQQNQPIADAPLLHCDKAEMQPLSFAQERINFLYQLEKNPAFHLQQALKIRGALDVARLNQCLNQLLLQHDILRTAYLPSAEGMRQKVMPYQPLQLQAEPNAGDWREQALKECQKTMDLSAGQVFRYRLFQLSEQEFILLSTFHHIAMDGQAMNQLALQLMALYQGEAVVFSDYQYQDFAAWQTQGARNALLQKQLNYWKAQLDGSENLHFPLKKAPSSAAKIYPLVLDKQLSQALKQLAKQQQCSLFMLMLALFSCLLYRYFQQDDFCIGTPVSGRKHAAMQNVLGCFLNLLAIRCEHKQYAFSDFLQQIKQQVLAAYENQDAPFEQVVRALLPLRHLSVSPLFQVLFTLQENDLADIEQWQGLAIESLDLDKPAGLYDLVLNAYAKQESLVLEWVYRDALFDEPLMENLSQSFISLCQAVVGNAGQAIDQLELLPAADKLKQLAFNQTLRVRQELPQLHHYIERQAAQTPNATALIFKDQALSYQALNEQANQLAHYLLQYNSSPFVAVYVKRSLNLPVVLLAILKAGLAYLPLPLQDPLIRLQKIMQDSQAQLLICDEALDLGIQAIDVNQQKPLIEAQQKNNPGLSGELFNLIYTSGTTGQAKGVQISHAAIINRLLWMQEQFALEPDDAVLQKTASSFDVSVWEIFWPLMFGARLVLAEDKKTADVAYLSQLITQYKLSYVHFVPSMLALFLQQTTLPRWPHLKAIICSGEALPQNIQAQCLARLPCALYNLYGPTEAAIDVSFHLCSSADNEPPIGKAMANCELYIVDKSLQLLPIGAVGEIIIGGRNLSKGYLNLPELNQKSFVYPPFKPDERFYRSGDLGFFDEQGNLYFVGRADTQVKVRGFRIELKEIEQILLQHGNIAEALVRLKQADQAIVAYFIADATLSTEAIRQFLAQRLPPYMLPNYFIQLQSWPLTSHGKIAYDKLPQIDVQLLQEMPYIAPRDEIEQAISEIWQNLLGIEKISIDADFFSLGGHSLLASLVIMQSQERFNVNIALLDLFAKPTIATLSDLVRQAQNNKKLIIEAPLKEGEIEIHL